MFIFNKLKMYPFIESVFSTLLVLKVKLEIYEAYPQENAPRKELKRVK